MVFFKRFLAVLLMLVLCMITVPMAFAAGEADVDDSKLLDLMAVAEKLQEEDYSAITWRDLENAMSIARTALELEDQTRIDAAASLLAKALSNMERMDCTELEAALKEISEWVHTNDVEELWDRLEMLNDLADEAMISRDQEAVDRLTVQINETLAQLKKQSTPGGSWVVWMILFFISLAANLGFVMLIIMRTRNIKKYQKDDVPLVDYDIDDDFE